MKTIFHAICALVILGLGSDLQAANIAFQGQSQYKIVVPGEKHDPAVDYAAKELQHFLEAISGAHLEIISELRHAYGPAFLIGPCRKSHEAGLLKKAAALDEDAVLIQSLGQDIVLLGQNARGTLYSVYVLLEKYMGVRFLAWDCTVVPKNPNLRLPKIEYAYASPFMYRETLYFNSFPKEIATRQRLNGPTTQCDSSVGGKIAFHPYVHSFDDIIPEAQYFQDHPEYFGLKDGKRTAGSVHAQICLTNPDVLRIAKETVLRWIEEKHEVPIFDVSQNDGDGWCQCENCMAVVNEEGGAQSGPILRFVNAIAEEVEKKHPEKWIETLAYSYSTQPPAITRPRANVIMRLCHAGCYGHGFTACPLGSRHAAWIEEWRKLTRRIFIWHYATNFWHYLAPCQNLAGLAKDLKDYGSSGVNGVMVQCNYQGPGGELAELRQYLCAQLLWDPSQDPMRIRRDFCQGYYGNAAEDVLEFLAAMDREASREDLHFYGAWDAKDNVTPEYLNNSLEILERARNSAGTPKTRNRVEKLMLSFWYMQAAFPDKYPLSEEAAIKNLESIERVVTENGITHVSEGDGNMQAWIRNKRSPK